MDGVRLLKSGEKRGGEREDGEEVARPHTRMLMEDIRAASRLASLKARRRTWVGLEVVVGRGGGTDLPERPHDEPRGFGGLCLLVQLRLFESLDHSGLSQPGPPCGR